MTILANATDLSNVVQEITRQLLNAGAALFLAGRAKSILEGLELAGESIDSGLVHERLGRWMRG